MITRKIYFSGQLGRPSGALFHCFERLKNYANTIKGTLFESPELLKAVDDIYRYSLRPTATDKINRQLRCGISDIQLAELVLALHEEDRLSSIEEMGHEKEPRIICLLGLFKRDS